MDGRKVDKSPSKCAGNGSWTWMAIGIAMGVAFGIAMDNLGVGIAIGVAIGIAVGAGRTARDFKKQGGDTFDS